jgi:sulfur-carrier protein adenylyltransferase/sulfurtransferase
MTQQYEKIYTRNYGVLTQEEQQRLKKACVTVVGAGGVGGITLLSLARLGVGFIRVIDADAFELSNLNRQMLGFVSNENQSKAQVASDTLRDINPDIQVETHITRLTEKNEADLLKECDVIIDATDNLVSRVIIHRAAAQLKIPSIWIAVTPPFRGGVMNFTPQGAPYERVLQHPSYQKELTDAVKKEIEALKDGRAQYSIEKGALKDWAQGFIQKKMPWAVICPVANMIGLLASVEAMKWIIKRENFMPILAPSLIRLDLSETNMVSVMQPTNGESWDNTTL